MRRTFIVATACAIALAGCAAEPPVVGQTPSAEASSALFDDQATAIIEDTFATIAKADKASDATLLAPRVEGDAVTVRTAEYAVAKAVADAPVTQLPGTTLGVYVSNSTAWPRVLAAVSEAPAENVTPVVYLWVQDSIAEPYTLRSWAHMIPGAVLPSMAGTVDGATQLPLGEKGVSPSPRAALEEYVEYLRQGAASELAANYAPDSYAEQLFAARDVLSQAASAAGGAYVDTVQPDLEATFVLSTADGGALVFAPLQVTSSFAVAGATLKVSDRDAPLLTGPVTTKATYTYRDFVVLSVPAPGLDQLPAVVAAEHHLVSVKPE